MKGKMGKMGKKGEEGNFVYYAEIRGVDAELRRVF